MCLCVFQGTLQQFVDDFFRSVLCSGSVVPPAVKYFFDFLDEQALRHDNVDEETLHIWKTNRYATMLPFSQWSMTYDIRTSFACCILPPSIKAALQKQTGYVKEALSIVFYCQ